MSNINTLGQRLKKYLLILEHLLNNGLSLIQTVPERNIIPFNLLQCVHCLQRVTLWSCDEKRVFTGYDTLLNIIFSAIQLILKKRDLHMLSFYIVYFQYISFSSELELLFKSCITFQKLFRGLQVSWRWFCWILSMSMNFFLIICI